MPPRAAGSDRHRNGAARSDRAQAGPGSGPPSDLDAAPATWEDRRAPRGAPTPLSPMYRIEALSAADWPAVWELLRPVLRAGDTYAFPPDIDEAAARRAWVENPAATFVARDADGAIAGTYYIKANQPGPGSHVCNCGYVTAAAARGRGVAGAMCEHSQAEAIRRGFRAMQFNLVVSTNTDAVRLWERHGFAIVGTLPGAFAHPLQGDVDAYVMFKRLDA